MARCLEKTADQRYQTAKELRVALERRGAESGRQPRQTNQAQEVRAVAHANLAVIYNHIGLLEEGLQAGQRSAAINPGATTGTGHIVLSMLWGGRYADALSAAASLQRGDVLPAFTGSQLAWALSKLGRKDEARRTVKEFARRDPSDSGRRKLRIAGPR